MQREFTDSRVCRGDLEAEWLGNLIGGLYHG